MKREVERLCVIANHRFRRFRGRNIVTRLGLIEIFEDGRRLPYFVVELAVDYGRMFEFRNRDGLGFFRRQDYDMLRPIAGFRCGWRRSRLRRGSDAKTKQPSERGESLRNLQTGLGV